VGGSVTINVGATINAAGSFDNAATVSATEPDPAPGNNVDNTGNGGTAVAPSADVAIVKNDGVASVAAGTNTSYAITVSNAGPDAAANVAWNDALPPGTTCLSLAAPGGWACTTPAVGTGGAVSCSTPSLPAGASAAATLTVNVDADASPGSVISNTATVSTITADADPSNNAATDADTVTAAADLAVAKSDGTSTVAPGAAITYALTVTNAGPSAVSAAVLSDPAVAGLAKTAVACAPTPGACTSAPDVVQLESGFALPPLAVGATYQLLVTATVTASGGTVTNTATVAAPAGTIDPVPGNNSASDADTIIVAPVVADLAIAKSDGVTQLVPGTSTTYTIVVTNLGPGEVSGATVADTAPAGLSFGDWNCAVSNPGAGGTVATACVTPSGSGNLAATVDMKAGAVVTFTLRATLPSSASGSVTNTVTVSAPAGVTDPTPANDAASDTDVVAGTIAPSPIPTLTEWTLLLLSFALGVLGVRSIRVAVRRR